MFDEETGEVIENKGTKHIKESLTDPESGCFHKGKKKNVLHILIKFFVIKMDLFWQKQQILEIFMIV